MKQDKFDELVKLQIRHRITGEVLFEHSTRNNSIKLTLETGVIRGAKHKKGGSA